jgi:hypothetical protein
MFSSAFVEKENIQNSRQFCFYVFSGASTFRFGVFHFLKGNYLIGM